MNGRDAAFVGVGVAVVALVGAWALRKPRRRRQRSAPGSNRPVDMVSLASPKPNFGVSPDLKRKIDAAILGPGRGIPVSSIAEAAEVERYLERNGYPGPQVGQPPNHDRPYPYLVQYAALTAQNAVDMYAQLHGARLKDVMFTVFDTQATSGGFQVTAARPDGSRMTYRVSGETLRVTPLGRAS